MQGTSIQPCLISHWGISVTIYIGVKVCARSSENIQDTGAGMIKQSDHMDYSNIRCAVEALYLCSRYSYVDFGQFLVFLSVH